MDRFSFELRELILRAEAELDSPDVTYRGVRCILLGVLLTLTDIAARMHTVYDFGDRLSDGITTGLSRLIALATRAGEPTHTPTKIAKSARKAPLPKSPKLAKHARLRRRSHAPVIKLEE